MPDFRTIKGLYIKHVSSDPSNLVEGDIWYNSTSQTLKTAPLIAAWSAGGDLNTGRNTLAGAGSATQTAGLAFGGYQPSPAGASNTSEEYNGSAWTEGNTLNTSRYNLAGAGTQTTGLAMGGNTGSATADSEEYNGTSWTEGDNLVAARSTLGAGGIECRSECF